MKYRKEKIYKTFNYLLIIYLAVFLNFSLAETFYSKEIRSQYYKDEINELISLRPNNIENRYEFYSSSFIGRPYKGNTLSGDKNNKEVLVVNLNYMDCFTYLDYVQSLIYAEDYYDFINKLKFVRYKDGIVSYKNRNHFFYNWLENVNGIRDVTYEINPDKTIKVLKMLNRKEDNDVYLQGIKIKEAYISYLKPEFINKDALKNLKSGDFIGIYSLKKGLDVSHVGILIVDNGSYIFRHASSLTNINKIVDMDFLEYIKDKPGIIIYRNSL